MTSQIKIPTSVVQIRKTICYNCTTPCDDYRLGIINHGDPCQSCKLVPMKFSEYGKCGQFLPNDAMPHIKPVVSQASVPITIQPPFGLGDAVAMVAQPIARAIDSVSGGRTNVAGCGGCKQRREALNRMVPSILPNTTPQP